MHDILDQRRDDSRQTRPMRDADLVARYIADRVREVAPSRWVQGPRRPALAVDPEASELVQLFATRDIYRLPRPVSQAIAAWSRGERAARVSLGTPTAREVLSLQAGGERCVSLLAEEAVPNGDIAGIPRDPTVYGSSGLAFAVHDLCHLEKFNAPETHEEQVGFFASLEGALGHADWSDTVARLDAAFQQDVDHVYADMNGASAFLFVVLRNKLKLAVRRRIGRERGARCGEGALDATESAEWEQASVALVAALGLEGEARDAALGMRSRHDAESCGRALSDAFRARGRDIVNLRRP